ncbi:MAG TPA: hypothetical protein PLQ36_01055 [Candidatus Gracilibacteria bacterium]|nr:hypothetical protein [Candidatus Gracilibacteria bacterium]
MQKIKTHNSAFSVIELIIVIFIITMVGTLSITSFSQDKDKVVLNALAERIEMEISKAKSQILSEKVQTATWIFNIENPRSYWIEEEYRSLNYKLSGEKLKITSLNEPSRSFSGKVNLTWDKIPASPNQFLEISIPPKLIKSECLNCSPPLNEYEFQNLSQSHFYQFQIRRSDNQLSKNSLKLNFLNPNNVNQDKNLVLINKIEVKNNDIEWISVPEAKLVISSPWLKKQFLAMNHSYQHLRITFSKNFEISQTEEEKNKHLLIYEF